MNDLHERLEEIARETFDDPDLVLEDDTNAADVPGWDSLAHVNFVYSIEDSFSVRFSEEEFAALLDVGALKRTLQAKLAAAS